MRPTTLSILLTVATPDLLRKLIVLVPVAQAQVHIACTHCASTAPETRVCLSLPVYIFKGLLIPPEPDIVSCLGTEDLEVYGVCSYFRSDCVMLKLYISKLCIYMHE